MLGPLLARRAGGPVPLSMPSAKQRSLLATLLLETPTDLVSTERLIDELWDEDPPATAAKALQVHVSQLRRTLGPEQPIITDPTGYAIEIEREALDLHRFDTLMVRDRRLRTEGNRREALDALRAALELWRGPALVDVTLLGRVFGFKDVLENVAFVSAFLGAGALLSAADVRVVFVGAGLLTLVLAAVD